MSLRRLFIFFFILIIFFSPPFYYLLSKFKGEFFLEVSLGIIFLTALSFPLFRATKIVKICFLAMGFMSFLLVSFIFTDFISFITNYRIANWTTLLIAFATTSFGLWRGRKPHLKKVEINIPNLPNDLKGLKIVHISDLHVGKNIGKKYVDYIVEETLKLSPDLIALTGDIGDSEATLHGKDLEGFKFFKPPLGIYYVPGNHEYYWNLHDWFEVMKSFGSNVLMNESKVISHHHSKILIAGITDTMDRKNPPDLNKPLLGSDKNSFKILLSHRPDPAIKASKLGYDLQLSGHTHGGQFFPWTLLVRFIHRHHLGLFQEGSLKVYVSGGTGSWGPLLRFGSSAELTLLTVT
jgi:hypothetical protein